MSHSLDEPTIRKNKERAVVLSLSSKEKNQKLKKLKRLIASPLLSVHFRCQTNNYKLLECSRLLVVALPNQQFKVYKSDDLAHSALHYTQTNY